jgi:hypothetical protein
VRELNKLADQFMKALAMFVNRRRQLNEYLGGRRLVVLEGDGGDGEFELNLTEIKELVASDQSYWQYVRDQMDGRRQHFLGHAEVRLAHFVREATGAFHYRLVEDVLEELRESSGQPPRVGGALKRRCARWAGRLSGARK